MTSNAITEEVPRRPVLASFSAGSTSEEDEEKSAHKQPANSLSGADSKEGQPNGHDTTLDFPWRWKVTALCLSIFLSFGSSFSENTLGPLKSTLVRQLDITNAQYGAISSASSLVNTILPVVGGCALDFYGVEIGSLVCSVFIFIGAVISAAGSNGDSFKLVMAGRIILGLGSTVIETCTSKILAHWFQRRGLGFVYGCDIAFGKVIVLAARASAVPMRDASSFWGWALWIPAILCFVNLVQNVVYVWWAMRLPSWTRIPNGRTLNRTYRLRQEATAESESSRDLAGPPKLKSSLPDIRTLISVPRFFWLVVCTQIMQAGTVGGFNGLSADIIRTTRGSTEQLAGYTSAIQQVIPIILCPLLGGFFDLVGYRMVIVSFVSALWVMVYALIGYSTVNALGVMIIASLAQAFNALPFIASIPLMVPSQLELGLVLGVWKAFNNCGSVIVDMIAGRLQDITPNNSYDKVIAFFLAWKTLEFCLGLFYGVLDRRYLGGILTMSERKRKVLENQGLLEEPIGRKPAKTTTMIGLSLMFSMIIIAWVLFFKYSL